MARKPSANLDDLVLELVDSGRIPHSAPHACPYLPGRLAIEEGFTVETLRPDTYHALMNRGFRRSGRVFYRPRCEECQRCVQIRVPVADFAQSRSQRRTWRKNGDVTIQVGPPALTDAKLDVYQSYLESQHPDSRQTGDVEGLRDFLYTTSVDTVEVTYSLDGSSTPIAVSILDVSSQSLSSVYHFFDPALRDRRLGVYSVLREVELARTWGVPYYYLGYWVEDASTMDYKADYCPHELLIEGRWVRQDQRKNQ